MDGILDEVDDEKLRKVADDVFSGEALFKGSEEGSCSLSI